MTEGPLLVVDAVTRAYPLPRPHPLVRKQHRIAVRDVSLTLSAGESLGVVGESGCGKSTLARLITALEKPDTGAVHLNGVDFHTARGAPLRRLRQSIQMVFQDPMGSLDPRWTVARIVAEPLAGLAPDLTPADRRARAADALAAVGLEASALDRVPHQFSGGQRQRIAIARALVTDPALVVADEPVSALDVSVQAQVLNLFMTLRQTRKLALLFISHDLDVVRHVTERIMVMVQGHVVEKGPTETVLAHPAHPHTTALQAAVPRLDAAWKGPRHHAQNGVSPPPSPHHGNTVSAPLRGCIYQDRCPWADSLCRTEAPSLRPLTDTRQVACHHAAAILATHASP